MRFCAMNSKIRSFQIEINPTCRAEITIVIPVNSGFNPSEIRIRTVALWAKTDRISGSDRDYEDTCEHDQNQNQRNDLPDQPVSSFCCGKLVPCSLRPYNWKLLFPKYHTFFPLSIVRDCFHQKLPRRICSAWGYSCGMPQNRADRGVRADDRPIRCHNGISPSGPRAIARRFAYSDNGSFRLLEKTILFVSG